MNRIIIKLSFLNFVGSSTQISSPLPLKDYLGADTSNFYRYEGSLTTPTCNEAVLWTVFKKEIGISERQVLNDS